MLSARIERWPIAGAFTISRGAKTEAVTVVAEVSRGGTWDAANACPIRAMARRRKQRSPPSRRCRKPLSRGLDRKALQDAMPPGAARNALDCALIDLEAKTRGKRAWDLLGRTAPQACITAYTISLGTPEVMAAAAAKAAHRPLAEDQARRRRRRGPDRRGAQGGARLRTHRRCQRGMDAR